jgi:hypothetical protein
VKGVRVATKEARDAAIAKAAESVRNGSGWVRSAETVSGHAYDLSASVDAAAERILVARFGEHRGVSLTTCTDELRKELRRDARAALGVPESRSGEQR